MTKQYYRLGKEDKTTQIFRLKEKETQSRLETKREITDYLTGLENQSEEEMAQREGDTSEILYLGDGEDLKKYSL